MYRPSFPIFPSLVVMTALFLLAGCEGSTVHPPCGLRDGIVFVVLEDGVRSDSADAALMSIGLPFDASQLRDCGRLIFSGAESTPDQLQRLAELTHAGVVGVAGEGLVFATFCGDPDPVIRAASASGEFTFDRMVWFGLSTEVTVPVGEEEDWIGILSAYPFILDAKRVPACID